MVKHSGGCHCGRVRFELTAHEDILVSECNCSICSKSGYLGLPVPRSRFTLLQGEDCLTTYTFNTHAAQHLFCRYCGVKSFYIPRSHPHGYNVNVRCLDPGTVKNMTVRPFDGRDWEQHSADFIPMVED
jgi:hypothetical protein